jgi:hypothetical protein
MSPTLSAPQGKPASPSPLRRATTVSRVVAATLALLCAPVVMAQAGDATASQLQSLQDQIQQLQRQLNELKAQQAAAQATPAAPAPTAQRPAASASSTGIAAGPLTLTFGGFTELASIFRNRNESADVGSNFSTGIPFPQSPQNHIDEFRESARQSRLSLLTQTPDYDGSSAEAYFETDFLGAAPTANSNESNSYNLRMRNIYGRYMNDDGFYLLAGQNWSLATLDKSGLTPRQENIPLTIDAQYVPGFNWLRVPQVRFVQSFGQVVSVGLSFESPQAQIYNGPNKLPQTTTINNAGGSLFAPTVNYALDFMPDIIAKLAVDPGFGHYEIYALGRGFRDRVATTNDTTYGGGVGAGLIVPLVPSILDFQASGLVGKGIGRYGSAQLSDVAVASDGSLSTISEYDVLFGFNLRPTTELTLYVYAGREHADATAYSALVGGKLLGYGYGSPLYNNSGCETEDSTMTCTANTSDVDQITGGGWWKYYQGPLGNAQIGLQLSYTRRETFTGVGGDPSTNITIGMISFRFYPYQK